MAEPLDPELLEILACPACKDRPPVEQEGDGLICRKCGRRYPIGENGIPVMLVEEATLPGDDSRAQPTGGDERE